MIRVTNLSIRLEDGRSDGEIVAAALKIPPEQIKTLRIIKKAVDARRRKGAPITFVCSFDAEIADGGLEGQILQRASRRGKGADIKPAPKEENLSLLPKGFAGASAKRPPVVAGFGPAGMFAALALAEAGLCPVVAERGENADSRQTTVEKFWRRGELNPNSNVQFGEGGAGAFSDGKLTYRGGNPLAAAVIETFADCGAPPEIKYLQKPHIGTDILQTVVKNIRRRIESLGGKVLFNAKLTDIETAGGKVCAALINDEERIEADALFLAIGHSARDTYELLLRKNFRLEPKAFAVGLRIEHPQELINKAQYGADADNPKLPAADYMLTYQDGGRGVYSFCMCPGGMVVASSADIGTVVTNGMSNFARNGKNANAAILAQVTPEDFGNKPLSGVIFQNECEKRAFLAAGGNYFAPVMSVGDFLGGKRGSRDFCVTPTYAPGVAPADFGECLPNFVTNSLKRALPYFDTKIKNFAAADAPLTGVETRSSAPCRILRGESFEAVGFGGIYPIGEGAGYAGGIVSSAVDGVRAAQCYLNG